MHIFDKFTAYAEDSTEYVVIQERRTHATLAKPDGYVDTFSLEGTGEVLSLHSDNIKIFRINSTDTLQTFAKGEKNSDGMAPTSLKTAT